MEYDDPDGDKVKIDWYVFPESAVQSAGGDFEDALQPLIGGVKDRKQNSATMVAPKHEGAYRLFVFATDKSGRTAYANIPFYVLPRLSTDSPARSVRFKKRKLAIQ